MKIEWILLAEGLGQDAKGAITAIGLNQNVLVAQTLPASTKRAIVAHLIACEGTPSPGDAISLRFGVSNPDGQVIAAQTAQAIVGPSLWPDLHPGLDFPVELVLTFHQYGVHKFELAVQAPEGPEIKKQLDFYVVRPAQDSAESKLIRKDKA
jgi:hypothetical protein